MGGTPEEGDEIRETDIVFDCPHCGKSLAIDYRGAGLTIPCTDCGRKVEVPIPEGMEITDIDTSAEEQEIQILNLRRALAAAEARIEQLQTDLEEMSDRRDVLERSRAGNTARLDELRQKVALAESSHHALGEALGSISAILSDLAGPAA